MMRTLKRILAVVVIALCVIGILVGAAGIVGVWQANDQVTQALVNTVSGLESVVSGIGEGLERLTDGLNSASASVALVEDTVTVAGETLAQSAPVLELLTRIFGDQLLPSVNAGLETARGLGESALAVNSALLTINTLPGISVPALSPELSSLAQDLVDLESQVEEGVAEIRGMKATAIEGVVTPVTDRTDTLQSRLETASRKAASASARVSETQLSLAKLRKNIPIYIDLASLVVSLVLAWLLLAQFSLLLHARDLWRTTAVGALPSSESTPALAQDSRPD
jgi:hypothetical protein